MLQRSELLKAIEAAFVVHSAVTIFGPRQCGKTTIARYLAQREAGSMFFDLEKASDRQRLAEPEQTLAPLRGLVD